MCGVKNGLHPHIKDIRDAEAIVLSSPINLGNMTAWMFSFISRLWCLTHVKSLLENKPVVFVSVGLEDEKTRTGKEIYEDTFIMEHNPKVIGEIYYNSAVQPCLKCGAVEEVSGIILSDVMKKLLRILRLHLTNSENGKITLLLWTKLLKWGNYYQKFKLSIR